MTLCMCSPLCGQGLVALSISLLVGLGGRSSTLPCAAGGSLTSMSNWTGHQVSFLMLVSVLVGSWTASLILQQTTICWACI